MSLWYKGPTLYLVFLVIVIVISAMFILSSSVQSYRINIAESTMTMTGKTRYNAPPLVLFIFQKIFLRSLFWNESYFSTQHGKQGLRKYVSQWKVTNESVKWNFFANNNTPVPLHNGWIRKIGFIQMRVKLLHFVQTNISAHSSNLTLSETQYDWRKIEPVTMKANFIHFWCVESEFIVKN